MGRLHNEQIQGTLTSYGPKEITVGIGGPKAVKRLLNGAPDPQSVMCLQGTSHAEHRAFRDHGIS